MDWKPNTWGWIERGIAGAGFVLGSATGALVTWATLSGEPDYLTPIVILLSGVGTWVVAAFAVVPWIEEGKRRAQRTKFLRFRLLDQFRQARYQLEDEAFIDGLEARSQHDPKRRNRTESFHRDADRGIEALDLELARLGELVEGTEESFDDDEARHVHIAYASLRETRHSLAQPGQQPFGRFRDLAAEAQQHCRAVEALLGIRFYGPIQGADQDGPDEDDKSST